MSNGAQDAIESVQATVDSAAHRISQDVLKIARWLMTFRVELKTLRGGTGELRARNDIVDRALQLMVRSIDQIESVAHELDDDLIGDLAGASGSLEALLASTRSNARPVEHAINDPVVRQQVLALTGGKCTYCEATLSEAPVEGQSVKLFVEHVIPSSKGGPNHLVNYVPSCGSCNSAKGDRHVLHFVRKVQPIRMEKSNVVPIVEAAE